MLGNDTFVSHPLFPPLLLLPVMQLSANSVAPTTTMAVAVAVDSTSALVYNIHTRENEVQSILSQGGIHAAIKAGNLAMARAAFQFLDKRVGGGGGVDSFNALHKEALGIPGKAFEEKFKVASATKSGGGWNHSVTPIHVAAINPDTRFLKALFDTVGAPMLNIADDENCTAVFYAAACKESTAPLQWLIARGANIHAVDKRGNTPLTAAVMAGAANNIPLLVPRGAGEGADEGAGVDTRGDGDGDVTVAVVAAGGAAAATVDEFDVEDDDAETAEQMQVCLAVFLLPFSNLTWR